MPKVKSDKKFRNHKETKESGFKQGIKFNTGLGQHILKNPLIVQSIVEKVSFINFTLPSYLIFSY
jgi:18S rRNA (adenine1779-N6/adenine1780-N6)-dimethyltransferase